MKFASNVVGGTAHKTSVFNVDQNSEYCNLGDIFSYLSCSLSVFPVFPYFRQFWHIFPSSCLWKAFTQAWFEWQEMVLEHFVRVVSNCKIIPLHLASLRWKLKDRYEITFGQLNGLKSTFLGALLVLSYLKAFSTHLADCLSNETEKKSGGKMVKI